MAYSSFSSVLSSAKKRDLVTATIAIDFAYASYPFNFSMFSLSSLSEPLSSCIGMMPGWKLTITVLHLSLSIPFIKICDNASVPFDISSVPPDK